MALPNENPRPFRLYVTYVDSDGYFLKISGQLDQPSSLMVESLFKSALESLEKGIGAVPATAIHEGIVCAAKYKDGTYYRAKIISTANLSTGLVGVHFIDYGNKDIISLSAIRFLDNYDPMFMQLRGQATDYYLSGVMHPSGRWEEPQVLKLQSLLCYAEYTVAVDAQTHTLPIISIQFKGTDLSAHLVQNRFCVPLPLPKQEALINQLNNENQQLPNWQPNFINEPPSYTEHVPFLLNQNFPANPASAMRLQQNITIPPFNGSIPPPSLVSQRLIVNKVSRTPVNLKAPIRQPQTALIPSIQTSTPPPVVPVAKPPSPKKSTTYKSRLLEVNSQHKVFVSFAEEGPELFGVQLVCDAKKLQDMMDDINRQPHSSLREPPMIGTVCLGRMFGDRVICRAIVMNLSGSQCKLFFVDFGDTEMVSYYDIFDIPEEFVKPNVFAMRFCLSGVKNLERGPHLNEVFKQLVNGKVLTLKVVAPEGPPLIQYGELYLENKNVLDLLLANMKDKLQFQWIKMLKLGSRHSVLVSYVDSCIKFFVQLSEEIDELNTVMKAVKVHCENSSSPGELPVGAACCARFPDDGNWYRARIRDTKSGKFIVAYVDYGNEQEVDVSDLRTITPDLVTLPAQAMKCALKGFENRPVETKTSNQLEMLALEKTLMADVVGVLSNDTMLVTLVDDTVSPSLDIARRMNQLSQPRSNVEPKITTPVKKEAPESFSSPEGSVPDEKKKNFRREKSFKDDRRPPREAHEEFGQRGGSFRNRDNRDGFDRTGPGRHSEKFGGRPERGERRGAAAGGPKPREQGEERWEDDGEASAQPNFHSRQNRDNQQNKDRYNRQDDWEENKPDDRGGRSWDNRPDRREHRDNRGDNRGENRGDNRGDNRGENRGDRRDNWGERKESWNQKREFKDNRGERGDRPRGNYVPKGDRGDRADRSFGSDSDKRSDKSFRSQDGRPGRSPAFKPRSNFTQVQYKELTDPVPLETPFSEPNVDQGAQLEVSVTWIISPESFYTQIMSLQTKFLAMMHKIPELYKGVRSYTGNVTEGSSVLARYPADGVLYRATIVSIQPFSKFIVRYIDFGNKQLVDAKDIWQLDRELMELPKMAVHCSLLGVTPKDGEWKSNPEIDLCFNAPRYQCIFQEFSEEMFKVSLWNNGVSVADMLVEKQLAVMSEQQSSATLKDEAIDLTIIIGQQILCKVTHVESHEKFFIQLDLDKADLVEKAIAKYDTTLLAPLDVDSIAVGVHCTLKHEGKIYRAVLNDVADASAINATLPDYGNTITTSKENLMILPTELSVYYYQSLECCFNNYTEESNKLMKLEELKERLTNNKFIVYINNVEGIRLVATLYEVASGAKVCVFSPDEGAYGEVAPLCARAVLNYNFGVAFVSHMENLNEIYLQKSSDTEKIANMLEQLYKFYEEGTPEELKNFEADGLCVVKSSDGNWYRGTIISSTETEATVQFPDYGNSETIPKESLKKLDPMFFEPCAFGLVVSLGLVALEENALDSLKEWTLEKEIQVTLAIGTDGWLANLHLDGVDLSLKLVNDKLATPQISTEEKVNVEVACAEEPISLPEGTTQVYITHIDSPGQFWLQMADKIQKIDEIQAELQADSGTYGHIDNREMGTSCIAKYSADDQWYRAEILDADSDITTVRFIDYGNTDVLDNEPGLLRAMPDHLREIDPFALKSSVNAVPTGTGQWSEPASDFFTQLCGDFSSPVDALIVLKDVTTYVDLFINGQNLTDKLVSEGHAAKSEKAECGDLPSCFASHVNSPSEFWIQLESATTDLQAMEGAMVDAENFPELKDKEEGVLCAAKYPEDGAWYRAQVIVDGSEGTEVLFMDYGNASIATELRSLPDELKVKPALSRKCALQKPRDIKSWSRKSEIKFNELAAEGATIFNVQFIASGDISIVELYLDGKSVTEELVVLCEEQPATERPTPVGQECDMISGRISNFISVNEFYVLLDESVSELDKITNQLSNATEFEPVLELKIGSICAAMWIEDERWYRGKIMEFADDGYFIQFIDHGKTAICDSTQLRQLPDDLAAIEPVAKCCCLPGIEDSNIKSKLTNYLSANDNKTFQIQYLDTTREPSVVNLLIDNNNICNSAFTESLDNVSAEIFIEPSDNNESNNNDAELKTENPTETDSTVTNDTIVEKNFDDKLEDEYNLNDKLNTSLPEADDSFDSNHTVIENKSFEEKESGQDEIEQDAPTDSAHNSEEYSESPKRNNSKDSITADTGYVSGSTLDVTQVDKNVDSKEDKETIIVSKETEVIKNISKDIADADKNTTLVSSDNNSKEEAGVEQEQSLKTDDKTVTNPKETADENLESKDQNKSDVSDKKDNDGAVKS